MPTRAEIIKAATDKGRKDWEKYLDSQNEQLFKLYQQYADELERAVVKAEKDGKVPIGAGKRLDDMVKSTMPSFRKSLAGSITRGISNSVDAAFKTQILAMNAAGIANKLIQLGTSFIGADGKVVRWNSAKESFMQSVWSKMNTDAVAAVKAWKPGGIVFSDRVWDITWTNQKKILSIIQQGVASGTSAKDLATQLRQYLAQPETLRGKAKAAYSPGPGVYKSASKNAMRLASNELNRAFNEGLVRYASRKDFIDGYIVRAGSAEPCEETCLPLRDRFFSKDEVPELPAHPWCRCRVDAHVQGDPMPGDKDFVPGLGPAA